jgi:hypothetical protein
MRLLFFKIRSHEIKFVPTYVVLHGVLRKLSHGFFLSFFHSVRATNRIDLVNSRTVTEIAELANYFPKSSGIFIIPALFKFVNNMKII